MEKNELPEGSNPERDASRPASEHGAETQHVITAKDAGWLTPTLFVAPASFIALDPPERRKRNCRRPGETDDGAE